MKTWEEYVVGEILRQWKEAGGIYKQAAEEVEKELEMVKDRR